MRRGWILLLLLAALALPVSAAARRMRVGLPVMFSPCSACHRRLLPVWLTRRVPVPVTATLAVFTAPEVRNPSPASKERVFSPRISSVPSFSVKAGSPYFPANW